MVNGCYVRESHLDTAQVIVQESGHNRYKINFLVSTLSLETGAEIGRFEFEGSLLRESIIYLTRYCSIFMNFSRKGVLVSEIGFNPAKGRNIRFGGSYTRKPALVY